MISKYVFVFLFSVFIASLSQILLKISADKPHKSRKNEYLNGYVIAAYALFFLSTILTVISLRGISLNKAPVLESTGYIYVMLLSRIILKERITAPMIAGNLLIIAGILVFNYSSII